MTDNSIADLFHKIRAEFKRQHIDCPIALVVTPDARMEIMHGVSRMAVEQDGDGRTIVHGIEIREEIPQ